MNQHERSFIANVKFKDRYTLGSGRFSATNLPVNFVQRSQRTEKETSSHVTHTHSLTHTHTYTHIHKHTHTRTHTHAGFKNERNITNEIRKKCIEPHKRRYN